jgi:hypothetical protein
MALDLTHLTADYVPWPIVWTGRALQAESDDLEMIGRAHLYPALERNVSVPGHHEYSRALDLIRVISLRSGPSSLWRHSGL